VRRIGVGALLTAGALVSLSWIAKPGWLPVGRGMPAVGRWQPFPAGHVIVNPP
jgi:hypothetical protein